MTDYGINTSDSTFQARFAQAGQSLQRMQQDYARPGDIDHEKLKKTAQEFEAVFFKQVIEQMDKTVERGDFLTGGAGEDTFRSMLFDEVAMRASNRPGGTGLGLAEEIYKQLSKAMKAQEEKNPHQPQQIQPDQPAMPAPKELKIGHEKNQLINEVR